MLIYTCDTIPVLLLLVSNVYCILYLFLSSFLYTLCSHGIVYGYQRSFYNEYYNTFSYAHQYAHYHHY